VADRIFTYVLTEPQVQYDTVKTFVVQIAADGRFQSIIGLASVSGRADGQSLAADVVGGACYAHFDVVRP
jgi:hypothetical protein